ncbi:MAG: NAD-dependent epimerase/dehydratase family protein [Bacteroidetes bacterium]|nr:NAD-dependent epimerase/dehydratase family protein [Bacteroidota bacterium]
MKILVTGPDGLLGSNLVRELLSRNYQVTAMIQTHHRPATLIGLPIDFITGDLLDANRVKEAVKEMDIVIHCAANTCMFPARAEIVNRVNIDGTKHVIDACLTNKVKRLIVVGSANSFGPGSMFQPGNETVPYQGYRFGLDYMDSKYTAKELVLDAVEKDGLDAVVVCPTFMIGPYDSRPSSGALILGVYQGKIPGYTNGGKNYIAVKDVAVGIANAIKKGRKGTCYILGNTNLTYKEVFQKIGSTISVKGPRFWLPGRLVILLGWMNSKMAGIFRYRPALTYELALLSAGDHYYSAQRAVKELDLPQTPIENAIKECFDWFKENGYLNKK